MTQKMSLHDSCGSNRSNSSQHRQRRVWRRCGSMDFYGYLWAAKTNCKYEQVIKLVSKHFLFYVSIWCGATLMFVLSCFSGNIWLLMRHYDHHLVSERLFRAAPPSDVEQHSFEAVFLSCDIFFSLFLISNNLWWKNLAPLRLMLHDVHWLVSPLTCLTFGFVGSSATDGFQSFSYWKQGYESKTRVKLSVLDT